MLAVDFGISHSSLEFETSDSAHEGASLFGHEEPPNAGGTKPEHS